MEIENNTTEYIKKLEFLLNQEKEEAFNILRSDLSKYMSKSPTHKDYAHKIKITTASNLDSKLIVIVEYINKDKDCIHLAYDGKDYSCLDSLKPCFPNIIKTYMYKSMLKIELFFIKYRDVYAHINKV